MFDSFLIVSRGVCPFVMFDVTNRAQTETLSHFAMSSFHQPIKTCHLTHEWTPNVSIPLVAENSMQILMYSLGSEPQLALLNLTQLNIKIWNGGERANLALSKWSLPQHLGGSIGIFNNYLKGLFTQNSLSSHRYADVVVFVLLRLQEFTATEK